MNEFFIEKKIYYHDTDCGGIVYYANYLKYFEESRTEFCAAKGVSMAEWQDKGIVFPVVHVEIDYKASARYFNVIRVYTDIAKIGNASIHFEQRISKGETLICKAKTVWACSSRDFKAIPVPEEIRKKLSTK